MASHLVLSPGLLGDLFALLAVEIVIGMNKSGIFLFLLLPHPVIDKHLRLFNYHIEVNQ